MGSDKAPSEDNLDPEEKAKVIPNEEEQGIRIQKALSSINNDKVSPLKRKVTIGGVSRKNENLNKQKTKNDYKGDSDESNIDKETGNIHKMKVKRNVESKDAYTQTERSDYMLIK